MWKAVEGVKSGTPVWEGENVNKGLSIEEVVDNTWQENEKSPEIAEPKWGGSVEFWIASLESCSSVLVKLGDQLKGLDPETIIYPHPISGPLNVIQRLE